MSKISIYQENNPMFRVDDTKKIYNKSDYHKVYEYDMVAVEESVEDFLETVFMCFNKDVKPEGYTGHSMSVGDIVEIDGVAYICANCGWNEVKWEEL